MLILFAVASIMVLTTAFNVPNSSEESRDGKSSKDINNQRPLISEERIKSLTSDHYAPASRPQLHSEREHYSQLSIDQNAATGGSLSLPNQAKQPLMNAERFSIPYSEHGFVNSDAIKPRLQLRPIELSQIEKYNEGISSNSYGNDPNRRNIVQGISGIMNYDYPFLSIQQKFVPASSDGNIRKEIRSDNIQLPVYRTHHPGPKNSEFSVFKYTPGYQSVSNQEPTLRSSEMLHEYIPANEATTSTKTKKITLPVVHVKNSQYIQEYPSTFEENPVLLNPGLNYLQPNLNFDSIGVKGETFAQAANNISPFQSFVKSFQSQVIPIQTASSTPEFPQHKGAAVASYPGSLDLAKIARTYEPLRKQPQLHFQNVLAAPIVNPYKNVNLNSKAPEGLRDNVGIIEMRPQQAPGKYDGDDSKYDRRINNEYGRNYTGEGLYESKNTKSTSLETDFLPSKSYPFKEYDDKFMKNSKINNNNDEDDKDGTGKFQSYLSTENDEDGRLSKYTDDYESPEGRRSNYGSDDEDEDGNERSESKRESEEDRKDKSNRGKYFTIDFDDKFDEFDDFYKEPLTKHKYVDTKELPEVKRQRSGLNIYKEETDDEENNDHPFDHNGRKNYRHSSDTKKRSTKILTNANIIGNKLTSNYGGFYFPSSVNKKIRTPSNEFRNLTGI